MGDRSYAAACFYAIPEGLEHQVAALVEEHFHIDLKGKPAVELEEYEVDETLVGNACRLADALADLSPDLVFRTWQSSYSGIPGDDHIQVPGLGRWDRDTDENSEPVVREEEAIEAVMEAGDLTDACQRLRYLYGTPWHDALKRIAKEPVWINGGVEAIACHRGWPEEHLRSLVRAHVASGSEQPLRDYLADVARAELAAP